MSAKLSYRPDIDGLRTVAVLSVLFYHAGINILSGGYVGVDVFFVISGYLITGILLKEIQSNTFSIINFYERRIRRILPAAFAVSLFVLFAGALIYNGENFSNISESLVATTLFASNFLFWNESGYFDSPPTLKPLLHTWSLSVEEQFYIFFPLLLLLINKRFNSRYWISLIVLAAISLAASILILPSDQNSAFYLMPLRAWELLIGSLIIFTPQTPKISPILKYSLSFAGAILIIGSVLLYTEDTLFPGAAAIPPVLGTALLIYFGSSENPISRILSLRPMVFIGKISYSLYLWHWPILVMAKYYLITPPTPIHIIVLLSLIMIVSAASWKLIENPFRHGQNITRGQIFRFAVAGTTLLTIFGLLVYLNNGFPQRLTQTNLSGTSKWSNKNYCLTKAKNKRPIHETLCTIGNPSSQPSFLLWGDSHARAIAPSLDASARKFQSAGYLSAMPSCSPLLGIDFANESKNTCANRNDNLIDYISENPNIKTVILAGRWALYMEESRYKNEPGTIEKRRDIPSNQRISQVEALETGLERTVSALVKLNRRVIIVTNIPEIGYDVPSSHTIATLTNRDINEIIAPTLQEYIDRNRKTNLFLQKLQLDFGIYIIDPSQILCIENKCNVVATRQVLYRDDDHLSTFGALFIADAFDPIFEQYNTK